MSSSPSACTHGKFDSDSTRMVSVVFHIFSVSSVTICADSLSKMPDGLWTMTTDATSLPNLCSKSSRSSIRLSPGWNQM